MAEDNPAGRSVVDGLPKHPLPAAGGGHRLRVHGLVTREIELDPAQLARYPQAAFTDDFACEEGWVAPGQAWQGVLAGTLLDEAGVIEGGAWVEFAAGDFRFTVPIEEARGALVASSLNGEALSRVHGGPSRLVLPGGACFTSIKWLDRIEVRSEPGESTAETTARARIAAGTS